MKEKTRITSNNHVEIYQFHTGHVFFDEFRMLAPRRAGNPVGYLEDISRRGHIGSDTTECWGLISDGQRK